MFGDAGDDWEEGGDMADLLIGDSSTFFFDDHNEPGHDVTIGQGGDDDYDGEGGDDIFVAGQGIEKNAGSSGYDWSIGLGENQQQFADLNMPILPEGQPLLEVRDRFNEVEALSGWNLNDRLFGDDAAPAGTGGLGFIGCDVLTQAGLNRITGLDPLVPTLNTPGNTILANTTTRYCFVNPGENVWGDGNILLGGGGSDAIEGRGADDIIDGDRYLNVRLSVRTDVANAATEIASTDLLENKAVTATNTAAPWGTGSTATMTLQQAVFAGIVDPGNIAIVREVLTPVVGAADCGAVAPVNCDVAVFSGPRANYTITATTPGGALPGVTVTDVSAVPVDGVDTLRNIEQLRFTDVTLSVPGAPTIGTADALSSSAIVRWTAPASNGGLPITGYRVQVLTGTTVVNTVSVGNVLTTTVTGLTNGTAYNFRVQAVNLLGAGPLSAASNIVTPVLDVTAPTVTVAPAAGATGVAVNANVTATFSENVTGVGAATFVLRNNATNAQVLAIVSYNATTHVATLDPLLNLAQGTTYRATLTGGAAAIRDLANNALVTTTWTFQTLDNTPPTVTARTPAVNATGVVVPVSPTATFSEAVNGVLTAGNVVLTQGTAAGPAVASVVTYNAGTRTVTINPNVSLLNDTRYTVTLSGITDLFGNALATTSWTFLTGPAPTVTARTPAANATAVVVPVSPTATLSEPVNGVLAAGNVTIRVGTLATGALVASVVSYDSATGLVTINPNASLLNDTRYTIRLNNITDLAGNPLPATSWTFLTGPAPSVAAQTPAANATAVVRTSNQTATFNEAMNAATIVAANVTLRLGTTPTGTLIARAVTYNATTRVVTINPNATLAANTVYTVRLTGITDAAGNPLPATTWSFTTGAV